VQIEIIEGGKNRQEKLRVCAYCRVSTDADEQENSLENQINHYKELIQANPEYEYAGVYSDFAISGFKEKRPGFQQMLSDARAGKINLILTKSVSRFARNTSIVLEATRELRELNVGVFFELQNINTLSCEGELMLTIIAAFAQAESESGSIVAKMAYRRKYERGIPVQYLERSFGYKKTDEGEFVPDKEEAEWVKKIYEMAADGYTPAAIKRFLNGNGVKTAGGAEWLDSTVFRLLENEIYKGDYIMHKHFVNEERKLVRNRGQVDAWYIEDDHVPIVSPELWQKAQDAIENKREYLRTGSVVKERSEENYPYKGKIFCAECGKAMAYKRSVYDSGKKKICYYSYICPSHENDTESCRVTGVRADTLMDTLQGLLQKQAGLAVEISVKAAAVRVSGCWETENKVLEKEYGNARKELERLRMLYDSLYPMYADEKVLTEQEYMRMKQDYRMRIEQAEKALGCLEEKKRARAAQLDGNPWLEACTAYRDETEITEEMAHALISRIEIHADKRISVSLRWQDEFQNLVQALETEGGAHHDKC